MLPDFASVRGASVGGGVRVAEERRYCGGTEGVDDGGRFVVKISKSLYQRYCSVGSIQDDILTDAQYKTGYEILPYIDIFMPGFDLISGYFDHITMLFR